MARRPADPCRGCGRVHPGPRCAGVNRKIPISVSLPPAMVEKLLDEAGDSRKGKSLIVERALAEYWKSESPTKHISWTWAGDPDEPTYLREQRTSNGN